MLAAISLSLTAVLGLGAVFGLGLGGARPWREAGGGPSGLLAWLAIAWLAGLQAAYAFGLSIPDLDLLAAMAGGFALIGGVVSVAALYVLARRRRWHRTELICLVAVVGIAVIYAFSIAGTPIRAWDARSIWFLHAKAIYFDGGLAPSPFWDSAAYDWSHKDYPKLSLPPAKPGAYLL